MSQTALNATASGQPSPSFLPAWWLRSPHAQTVWGRLSRPRRLVSLTRERITTPDDDDLFLDHLNTPDSPLHFILLHGLEGSSYSVYIQGMLSVIGRLGFSATAINYRSCARDPKSILRSLPNRQPRFYHSGETTDFDFVLRMLSDRMPEKKIVAAGASLGGNVLLKWLGEHPDEHVITAAAALSVPYDLGAGSRHLEQTRVGRFYVRQFLNTLKPKVATVIERFPQLARDLALEQSLHVQTFRDFDDTATAPLHGFASAEDYYNRSSSIHFVGKITTPTLCLNAEDDPFLPAEVLPRVKAAASAAVDFRTTSHGGHTGFVGGRLPWACEYWAEELIIRWLANRASSATSI